jgi:hypothetical protein
VEGAALLGILRSPRRVQPGDLCTETTSHLLPDFSSVEKCLAHKRKSRAYCRSNTSHTLILQNTPRGLRCSPFDKEGNKGMEK